MCEPTHFSVSYDVNLWMTRNVGYSAPDAKRQWARLVETLTVAADVQIDLLDPVPHLPGTHRECSTGERQTCDYQQLPARTASRRISGLS